MVNRIASKKQQAAKISLNNEQNEAVHHSGGPLLVTAGAGSGKTRTLTERLIYLLGEGVPGDKIIALTFTNKAADEMRSRIRAGFSRKGRAGLTPFVGTFHSLCAAILRKEAKLVGRTRDFVIFDSDDSLRVIKKLLKSENLSKKTWLNSPVRIQREISEIKNSLLHEDDVEEDFVLDIFKRYEASLEKQNAFDFDDLIEKVVRILGNHELVLKKYQTEWQHVLVDECQDINLAQYAFLKKLSEIHQNIFVIGDDYQAIYGFRNADFRYFLNFEKEWHGAKVINLGENYRSTSNIVRAAAEVIKNNKLQRRKKLWTENSEGSLIKVVGAADAEDEAEQIIGEVLKYQPLVSGTAILYRTNAQSRALEQTLNFNSIPYEIFGGVKFYERKEIKDVVAGLRYAMNPKDEISLERLDKAFNKPIYRRLERELPEMSPKLSLLELIGYFLKTTNYFQYLGDKFQNAEERTENIQELIGFAEGFTSLPDFLERIALLQSTDKLKSYQANEPNIKLMTIHLAKGLEFDSVYIAGANEGILPHQRSLSKQEDLEEERRLMYVAMTRARKQLTISFYDLASRFLYEIPPELIDFSGPEKMKDEDEVYLI